MHLLKTDFNGNPNIGLYGFCTDEFCLIGMEVNENKAQQISEALGVPVHRITMCGTSLVGVFIAGNSKKILVPGIAFDSELKKLDKLGIDYSIINTNLTALGNNILCNEQGCLVNPDFSSDVKKRIREALMVSLKPGTIAELPTVGSLAIANSNSGLIHPDITEEEYEKVSSLLSVNFETGTINLGSPFLKSGVLCNKNGFVVGSISGGPEIAWIDEALGYLEQNNSKNK
ncbi:translation initiation factor IF-6 [Candidatus Woesearchaeota archaeon]|nr:translation initiation factor IF-6 [Candidatus Woesearchaeota archaeon]